MYFKVVIRHNLIEQIQCQESLNESQLVLATNLEASQLLAENFQVNHCIDGDYCFDDAERAKTFASVSMDFTMRLLQSRVEKIDRLNCGESFIA